MASAIDPTKPTAGQALTSDVRTNFQIAANEISALQSGAGLQANSITDTAIGTRTPDQTQAAQAGAGTLTQVISWLANALKATTGETNWYSVPGTALKALVTSFNTSIATPDFMEYRLTLTTGVPVTTADVTGATTIYLTPYQGNRISLYNGTSWGYYTPGEISLALGTITNATPYDVFCYLNGATPTLELLAWTNGTTRAVALSLLNGVYVKSTDNLRRYIGTIYTTSTTTTEDSAANRYVWNYYNRISKDMVRHETTASWAYTTATLRQANANTANQLNFVVGISEDVVSAVCVGSVANTNTGVVVVVGIGINSTSAITSHAVVSPVTTSIANGSVALMAFEQYMPSVGVNFLAWLEYSAATGTSTWTGTPTTTAFAGIEGTIRC